MLKVKIFMTKSCKFCLQKSIHFKIIVFLQLFVLKLSIFICFEHTAIRNDNVSGMPILIIRINSSSLSLYLSFSTVRLRNAFSCFFFFFLGKYKQNFWEKSFQDNGVKWRSLVSENNKLLQCVFFSFFLKIRACGRCPVVGNIW